MSSQLKSFKSKVEVIIRQVVITGRLVLLAQSSKFLHSFLACFLSFLLNKSSQVRLGLLLIIGSFAGPSLVTGLGILGGISSMMFRLEPFGLVLDLLAFIGRVISFASGKPCPVPSHCTGGFLG